MGNKHFQEIIENLLNRPPIKVRISNSDDCKDAYMKMGSLLLLFMEHCRRCALWAKKLNYVRGELVYREILLLLNDSWHCKDEIEPYITDLKLKIDPFYTDMYLYLSWHFYKEQIDAMGYRNMPDPYQPLLEFVFRKGITTFKKEPGGIIVIWGSEFRIPKIDDILKKTDPFIIVNDEKSLEDADIEFQRDPKEFIETKISPYTKCYRLML